MVESGETAPLGVGIDGRLGHRFGLPAGAFIDRVMLGALNFEPELLFGFQRMPVPQATTFHDQGLGGHASVGWIGGGLRIGTSGASEPFIYAHVSAGELGTSSWRWMLPPLWKADTNGVWGTLTNVGMAWDGRLGTVSIGIHGEFNRLWRGNSTLTWVAFGPHTEFRW